MSTHFEIDDSYIAEQNEKARAWVQEDYEHLGNKLRRRNVSIAWLAWFWKASEARPPGANAPRWNGDAKRFCLLYEVVMDHQCIQLVSLRIFVEPLLVKPRRHQVSD